jgi:hypothetical protein
VPEPEGPIDLKYFIHGVEEGAEELGDLCGSGEKHPSAAKAGDSCCARGTTEVVPFQSIDLVRGSVDNRKYPVLAAKYAAMTRVSIIYMRRNCLWNVNLRAKGAST